jgi:hypothetical protein
MTENFCPWTNSPFQNEKAVQVKTVPQIMNMKVGEEKEIYFN